MFRHKVKRIEQGPQIFGREHQRCARKQWLDPNSQRSASTDVPQRPGHLTPQLQHITVEAAQQRSGDARILAGRAQLNEDPRRRSRA